jgi:hypothetical protein
MPKQLLNLRYVTDEEADEVVDMLQRAGIEHYLTPPGSFGISAGGIWLVDEHDHSRAKALMDEYQAERSKRVRQELERARSEGRAETFWSLMRRRPLRTGVYLAAAVFILMVLFAPVVQLARSG